MAARLFERLAKDLRGFPHLESVMLGGFGELVWWGASGHLCREAARLLRVSFLRKGQDRTSLADVRPLEARTEVRPLEARTEV